MHIAKRIGYVVAAATASGLPGAMAIQANSTAPLWYKVAASLFGGLGVGVFALSFGLIVLLAARGKSNQGIKAAIIVTIVAGLFSSWSVFYGIET